MDGMLTRVVGEVRVEDQPRPFCTSDALAARVMETAHSRAMAEEARRIAAQCRPSPTFHIPAVYDPSAAVLAAEQARRDMEGRRAFHADKLRGLLDAERITRAEFRAADEIRMLIEWEASGRQLLARSQFRERLAASFDTGTTIAILEEAERERYQPWRLWASAFPVKADRSLEDLTRAVVVQNLGMEQVGRSFGMDRRRALALLRRSLGCYAVLAGWMERTESA
jgi:hypothetical protein